MKFKKLLLREAKEFFDYHTAPVDLLTGDVIDIRKTGMSFYDDLLPNGDPEYMQEEHNLIGHIEYMTPNEYYKQCSLYGFPGGVIPVEKLKQERRIDEKTLEHLKDVLTDYGRKFPLPFVNKAERGQEGLHRMMVLGDMFGWDKGKYPVLVITWADDDRAKRDKQARIDNDIRQDIKSGVQKALQFTYYNIDEFKEQLQDSLDRSFEFSDYVKPPVHFTLTDGKTWPEEDYAVTVNNVSYEFEKSSVKLKEPQPVDDDLNDVDIDIDDIEIDELDDFEDTEDFLKRYFGDNWRETNPELKKTFGIKEAVERLDLKQMDEVILSNWGATTPGEGCIFIHPSGKFINIYPKIDDHEDLCYWLEEKGFGDNPEDADWFVDEFKYIRCRNSLHLCFVELPAQITRQQLYSLEEWFETKVSTDYIDIGAPNGEWKHYNLDEYFPEDLIKIIKRFYSSGKLYEDISDIKRSWSKETAHPIAQKYWTEENPSLGQCAITALYLNEKYGYSIWETLINNRNRHFFNKDNDGNIIDLTKDQFSSNVEIDYENSRQRDPKQLLRSCNNRYQLFKKNLNINDKLVEMITARESGYVVVLDDDKVLLDSELTGKNFSFGDYNDSETWHQAAIHPKSDALKLMNWANQVYEGNYYILEVDGKDDEINASDGIKQITQLLDVYNHIFNYLHDNKIINTYENQTLNDVLYYYDRTPEWLQELLSGEYQRGHNILKRFYENLVKISRDEKLDLTSIEQSWVTLVQCWDQYWSKYPSYIKAIKKKKQIHD